MSTEGSVKVGIRLKPGDGLPAAEWMWAKPIRAHDGGGTYELHNTSFYVPLAVGDVVRAEVNGDGLLQVTDIVCPGPRVMSWAVVSLESSGEVAAIGDRWRERGANWSEGSGRVLSTVWDEGVSREQVEQALAVDLLADRIEWIQVIEPDERTALAQEDIDFELDSSRIPEVTTTYWAADDPFWREHGLDEPDFLAYIQTRAGDDQQLASALETGDYDTVREIVAFINDGPLW